MSNIPAIVPTGAIRYNTDSNKMECFNGTQWMQVSVSSPDLGGNGGPAGNPTGNSADQVSGARGLIMGGSSYTDTIEYITIPTTGNGIDFGNLDTGTMITSGCSSNTRGLCMGGRKSPGVQENRIEYVTIQSTGDGTDFGDLLKPNDYGSIGNLGNATRGMVQGGHNPAVPSFSAMGVDMNYVTIASTGHAVKFGECRTTHLYTAATFSSPTRGVIAGGGNPGGKLAEFITISTTGNASDFGNCSIAHQGGAGASSSVVGLVGGGYGGVHPGSIDHYSVQKFIIATTGNSIPWGDLTDSRRWICPLSDSIRAVWCGGYAPGSVDTMDYNMFASSGNSVDFGNLTVSPASRGGQAGASSGHGGL